MSDAPRRIASLLANAVDEDLLARLAPDVVLTQTHCEVCAVSPADLAHAVPPRLERRQVVALASGTVEGVLSGFISVADVVGAPEAGSDLVERIRTRLGELARQTRALVRPSVLCLEWLEPPFAIGNWGPELIELAGGSCALGAPGAHSTAVSWDAVHEVDAEVLVIAPCGFRVERTLAELPPTSAGAGWTKLRAVRTGRVYVADGNLYFNRSGPLLFETPRMLAEILHPEVFSRRHGPEVWRQIR